MDREEMEKQREIGKQILMARIIHCENEHAYRTGISHTSLEDIAMWTSKTKEEVEDFVDICAALDPFMMADYAARDCYDEAFFETKRNVYYYIRYIYQKSGCYLLGELNMTCFEEYCEIFNNLLYEQYNEKFKEFPVDESFATREPFELAMRFYLKYAIGLVKTVIAEGYDWDVISEMMDVAMTEERLKELERVSID